MKIQSKEITEVGIDTLVPHPKNSHKHSDEQIERLCKLIEYQGFRNPIIAQKGTNLVVAGHGRILAAKKLGMKTVPVTYQEFENEAQLYSYIVSDNAIGKDTWATLDLGMISEEVKDLGLSDLELLGLKDFTLELPEEKVALTDEDEVPEVEIPITIKGDVWLLGNHRLMCGDSTVLTDVEKLMDGKKAKLFHTDPPYGVDYEGVTNDHLKGEAFRKFLFDCFSNAFTVLELGSNAYVWHADIYSYEVIGAFRDAGFKQARPSIIQWVKDSLILSMGDYHLRNEPCLYGWKEGSGRKRVSDRTQDTIWEFPKPKKAEGHPTMKPVDLCLRVLENSSEENCLVLDLFTGSGSNLIACEKSKRAFRGLELEPKYVDLALTRWQNYTGKQAVLESTGQTYEELKLIRSKA